MEKYKKQQQKGAGHHNPSELKHFLHTLTLSLSALYH